MLKRSSLGRKHNPIRYEIHGNVQKILGVGKVFVSDLLSKEVEKQFQKVLLKKYRQIKKCERINIGKMKRCDSLMITLTLLSEKDKRYQERIISIVDTLNVKEDAKLSRKTFFRNKFRQVPHEKCSFSIENLIVEAFRIDALNSRERNYD